ETGVSPKLYPVITGSLRRSESLTKSLCALAVFEPTANVKCGAKRSQPCHAALVPIEHSGESGTNRRIDQEIRHCRIEEVIQAFHGLEPNDATQIPTLSQKATVSMAAAALANERNWPRDCLEFKNARRSPGNTCASAAMFHSSA